MSSGDDTATSLAEARRTIEAQAREIERLHAHAHGKNDGDALGEKLRELLELTATAGIVAAPVGERDELRAIVRAAASVLDAEAAALFLVDEEHDELKFEVALGGRSEIVENLTLPLGEGLAGYVASTGQPLAVSNVEKDARFASAFAQKVAYIPKNILCVPMTLADRTVGVLEMLDKRGGVPFGVRDIEILGHFARLAALTVQQMRLFTDLRHLFRHLMADVLRDDEAVEDLGRRFADHAADRVHGESLRLGALVWQISHRGDAARRHAIDVLTSVARLLDSVAAYAPAASR
ncbi:MAG: GAF domain-containing protein [Polyangiaceae bacterium]|jgi:GAF domain-containing protein